MSIGNIIQLVAYGIGSVILTTLAKKYSELRIVKILTCLVVGALIFLATVITIERVKDKDLLPPQGDQKTVTNSVGYGWKYLSCSIEQLLGMHDSDACPICNEREIPPQDPRVAAINDKEPQDPRVAAINDKIVEYERLQTRAKKSRGDLATDQENYEKEKRSFEELLEICKLRQASGVYPTIIRDVSYTEETLIDQIESLNRKIEMRDKLIKECELGELKLGKVVTLCDSTIDSLRIETVRIKSTQFDDVTDAKEFLETEIYPKIDGVRDLDQLLAYEVGDKDATLPSVGETSNFADNANAKPSETGKTDIASVEPSTVKTSVNKTDSPIADDDVITSKVSAEDKAFIDNVKRWRIEDDGDVVEDL